MKKSFKTRVAPLFEGLLIILSITLPFAFFVEALHHGVSSGEITLLVFIILFSGCALAGLILRWVRKERTKSLLGILSFSGIKLAFFYYVMKRFKDSSEFLGYCENYF